MALLPTSLLGLLQPCFSCSHVSCAIYLVRSVGPTFTVYPKSTSTAKTKFWVTLIPTLIIAVTASLVILLHPRSFYNIFYTQKLKWSLENVIASSFSHGSVHTHMHTHEHMSTHLIKTFQKFPAATRADFKLITILFSVFPVSVLCSFCFICNSLLSLKCGTLALNPGVSHFPFLLLVTLLPRSFRRLHLRLRHDSFQE